MGGPNSNLSRPPGTSPEIQEHIDGEEGGVGLGLGGGAFDHQDGGVAGDGMGDGDGEGEL